MTSMPALRSAGLPEDGPMTSFALQAVVRLRRLSAMLAVGDDDSKWLASRLIQYLDSASRGLTVDAALDLAPLPGIAAWWTEATIEARDTALRDLAASFHPGRRPASQAYQIERQALRYAASAWRFDQERDDMPERYAGTETACLWAAFKSGAQMPIAKRQLQSILAVDKHADAPQAIVMPREIRAIK